MTRLRVLPCACGTSITANPDDPMLDVQRHQATRAHSSWAELLIIADREYDSLDPTAQQFALDVSARIRVRPAKRAVLVGLGYEL